MTAAASIQRGSAAPKRRPSARPKQQDTGHLRLVSSPAKGIRGLPSVRWVVLSLLILAAVFVTQLVLSIAISQGAYEVQSLEQQKTELGRAESAALEDLSAQSSAQNLAVEATKLGMVPTDAQAYLDVSASAVVGAQAVANPAGPINPALVTNEVTQPTKPTETTAPAPGVSPEQAAAPAVPSITELRSPSTR